MMVAILSDIHANLPALERFVQCTKQTADAYICLGDVVNYGPWNDECLELICSLPGVVLLEGNHERLFLGVDLIEDQTSLVQEFFTHSIRSFCRRDLIFGLPTSYELGQFVCTHTINNKKIYADTAVEVTRNYMIGHTHRQFRIERSGKVIVNCGSIGQNRAGIEMLNYALYDTCTYNLTLHQEPYPLDQLVNEFVARGYSRRCVDYYLGKRRGVSA